MDPIPALMARCRALGVDLRAEDGALRCRAAVGILTPELTAEIREHKPGILAALEAIDPYAQVERDAIQSVEREAEDPHPHLGPEYRTFPDEGSEF